MDVVVFIPNVIWL